MGNATVQIVDIMLNTVHNMKDKSRQYMQLAGHTWQSITTSTNDRNQYLYLDAHTIDRYVLVNENNSNLL